MSWPVSLIVSPRAIRAYQLLFRHLFQCMHTQRHLGASWHAQQVRSQPLAGRNGRKGWDGEGEVCDKGWEMWDKRM